MKKYTQKQCEEIMKIYIEVVNNKLDEIEAKEKLKKISVAYPIDNKSHFKKKIEWVKSYLEGKGKFGYGFSANWAKAFLEVTNYNPRVIKALKEQQELYLKKKGKNNKKLENLLENL